MSNKDGLIPLVVGVTGHRNPAPECIGSIEERLEQIFAELDALVPDTPIVLLSPLAVGCDRIAARVARRFRRKAAGRRIELIGVMPLRLDDYRRDFAADPKDAAEFEQLLSECDDWFELPAWECAERDDTGGIAEGRSRDLHYRRLGLYVALQAQVMIAMWDGVRNNKVGGTAEVVDFCDGLRPRDFECGIPYRRANLLLVAPDTTPVYCIPTRRGADKTLGPDTERRAAEGVSPRFIEDARDLNELNSRLAAGPAEKYRSKMLPSDVRPEVRDAWRRMEARWRRIDALAIDSQVEYLRLAKWLPASVFIGVGSFQWFSSYAGDLPKFAWISVLLYFIGLLVACGLWWWSVKCRRNEWIFVHARGLAEAMRVQLAWTGSGIDEVASEQYLARRQHGVAFLRAQLRAALLECAIVSSRGGIGRDTEVGKSWIDEQFGYFCPTGKPMTRRRLSTGRQNTMKWLLAGGVLLLSLGLLGISIREAVGSDGLVNAWANFGCFLVGLFLAATVAFDYWSDVTLDAEDLAEGARMREVFLRAQTIVREQPSRTSEVLRAMGKEALDEQADWFARHRERLKLPDAG